MTTQPSGPKGALLSGHLPMFRKDSLRFLDQCAREYGDIVRMRFAFIPVYVLNNPDYIESVLVAQNRHFIKSEGVRQLKGLLGNGLLTSEGDFWRRQRRLSQPAFHHQRIAAYGDVMVDLTRQMLDRWRAGETRDLHKEMMRLTLAIAAKTLFSAEVDGDAAVVDTVFAEIVQYLNDRLSSLAYLLPESLPLPQNIRYRRAVRQLDEVVYRIINQRRASGEDRGDLLSMLLQAQDEDGSQMTDKQLRDEVMTLFLAGHETTAVLLSWTGYLLSQHPAVEQKLADEVEAVLGGRAPTVADLPQLRYAEWVIQETLRLYPPAWLLGREPLQDCEFGGFRVPKGSILLMSPWVMHRDARYFENPAAFNPDRWANGLAKTLPRFAYFPFGGGPRLCIGNQFAMMEAVLVLVSIIQRYRLNLAPGQQVIPQPLVTLRPGSDIKMQLSRRERDRMVTPAQQGT